MSHGTPDWGLVGPKQTTFGLDDLGEHAVRVGSPHLWDRRGDVVYISDFSEGFESARQSINGASCGCLLSCGHTRSGAFSVKVTGDGVAACQSGVQLNMPFPVRGRLGAEFSFSNQSIGPTWRIWMQVNDRARSWEMGIEIDSSTFDLNYLDENGFWTPFANVLILSFDDIPDLTMKVVVDMATHEYVRTVLNDQEFLMAGLQMYDTGPIGTGWWHTRFRIRRAIGEDTDEWLDSVILTQNEP